MLRKFLLLFRNCETRNFLSAQCLDSKIEKSSEIDKVTIIKVLSR